MQPGDIIYINIWDILISLANLTILFFVIKKFLYKPVMKTMAKRQEQIDTQYAAAKEAQDTAQQHQAEWEERMTVARETADTMIKNAADTAKRRGDAIMEDAKQKADVIVRQAETQAELERRNAEEGIRREIVDLSTALAGKMLEREVKAEDHRQLIDSFLDDIGDAHD